MCFERRDGILVGTRVSTQVGRETLSSKRMAIDLIRDDIVG